MTATTAFSPSMVPWATSDGIIQMGLVARFLQPIGIALGVTEAQRVATGLGSSMRVNASSSKVHSRRSVELARIWWPQCGQTFRLANRSRWKIICWQAGHWCHRLSGTSPGEAGCGSWGGRIR